MFTSDFIEVNGRRIHYIQVKHDGPTATGSPLTPLVALHGLGGSSSFWVPAFAASNVAKSRRVVAYDSDGHGLSSWSGREKLSMADLVEDLKTVLDALKLEKVVLLVHSMSGITGSLFAQQYPERVEKLIMLHPVRNLGAAGMQGMEKRAQLASSSIYGLSQVANTVSTGAVSKHTAATNPSAQAFIRHLVLSTNPDAYAAACRALANAPKINASSAVTPVSIVGGKEDYLAGPDLVDAWANEIPNGQGSAVVLDNVGHWGAIEAPQEVGEAINQAPAPSSYYILLGTFRSPYIYTLSFDLQKQALRLLRTNEAVGGHSWLDLSPDRKTLYTTGWTTPPTVSSYSVIPASAQTPHPTTRLSAKVQSKHLSGYVCSSTKAMYSACGPQVDVFLLNETTGALLGEGQQAEQSFSLVSEEDMHKGDSQMDFGGLRHGGHSCDLSPDGSKLYVADIGRNCVWMYHVDHKTGLLREASKNIAKRGHDGPRHAWPHPDGKIVYSLQEHSSYVDVLQLSQDGYKLEWLEGVNILPPEGDCKLFWADEVRLSPSADILFGSTRGLDPETKGYVAAWGLSPDGRLADSQAEQNALHRFETRTSGGWANAIAVCPTLGRNGEVYLTLTDSEEGFIQVLSFTRETGFKVVDEVKLGSAEEKVGASVAVWL